MVVILCNKLHHRVLSYGSTKHVNTVQIKEEKAFKKKSCIVLLPESRFSLIWNMFMIILMFYIVIFVTFDVSFNSGYERIDTRDPQFYLN